jgi:hypothetical protein
MDQFRDFKQAVQRRFNDMKAAPLYRVQIDKDFLWQLYLDSFPEGSNPKFRERTEYDCSCCRSFVKHAGGMVSLVGGKITSIWDIDVGGNYQVVADALAEYVNACPIENVFLHSEPHIGTDRNREDTENGVVTWEHFYITLPTGVHRKGDDIGSLLGAYRASHDVVLRGLMEITTDAIETVRDLISQNSLYRGAEKKAIVDAFAGMMTEFCALPQEKMDLYAWQQVTGPNAWVCKIRNDVIGTLLVDLSEGVELETAVKSFEDKVSGTNYKRPTALITPRMRDNAKQTLTDLGLMDSLNRRYAVLEDISVTNVLFADRSAKRRMSGDVFDSLPTQGVQTKSLDKIEEIPIDDFIANVLPTAKSLEVLFENRHSGNLVSLIAPEDLTAKSLFKWGNPFSWSYSGDVADSIKERVKHAGGNVTGDVCCRLAWFNHDDLDFHMQEPGRYEIMYTNKRSISPNGGMLDVDMNVSPTTREPVENIFYTTKSRMKYGEYVLFVHQFTKRESTDVGFEVEVDVLGTVHHFSYPNAVKQGQKIEVARLRVTTTGVEVIPVLPSSQASREVWGMKTQDFRPVTAVMLSPNFWDDRCIGNKHFFFMLDGCRNDGSARGFYNEFLSTELEPHRKTMEIVGSKMRTEEGTDQMSGLGFSSTQRNNLVVRVTSSFVRTVKIVF